MIPLGAAQVFQHAENAFSISGKMVAWLSWMQEPKLQI